MYIGPYEKQEYPVGNLGNVDLKNIYLGKEESKAFWMLLDVVEMLQFGKEVHRSDLEGSEWTSWNRYGKGIHSLGEVKEQVKVEELVEEKNVLREVDKMRSLALKESSFFPKIWLEISTRK